LWRPGLLERSVCPFHRTSATITPSQASAVCRKASSTCPTSRATMYLALATTDGGGTYDPTTKINIRVTDNRWCT
jgi:hypothetical protein